MCQLCNQTPCANRCPNVPESIPITICSECGEGVYEGDEYFDGPDGPICKDCMEDKNMDEILEVFGEKMKTAEVA